MSVYGQSPAYPSYPAPALLNGGYAHWIKRVAATLVDFIVGYLLGFICGFIVGFTSAVTESTGAAEKPSSVPMALIWASTLIWYAINFGYLQGVRGQSVGKMALRIKLVNKSTGAPVGFWMAILRIPVHLLDVLPCYLGYLWPLWDAERRTFADMVLNQRVVTK